MKIESEKIALRPFETEFAATFYQWYYSGKYDEYFRHCGETFRLADFQKFVESPTIKIFCTFEKETGNLIGTCGIYDINHYDKSCKLMVMQDEGNRNKGYMFDALKLLCDLMFIGYRFHKISVAVLETNERVNALTLKGGFEFESKQIESSWHGGRYINENIYYMLESKFKEKYYGICTSGSTGSSSSTSGEGS